MIEEIINKTKHYVQDLKFSTYCYKLFILKLKVFLSTANGQEDLEVTRFVVIVACGQFTNRKRSYIQLFCETINGAIVSLR